MADPAVPAEPPKKLSMSATVAKAAEAVAPYDAELSGKLDKSYKEYTADIKKAAGITSTGSLESLEPTDKAKIAGLTIEEKVRPMSHAFERNGLTDPKVIDKLSDHLKSHDEKTGEKLGEGMGKVYGLMDKLEQETKERQKQSSNDKSDHTKNVVEGLKNGTLPPAEQIKQQNLPPVSITATGAIERGGPSPI